MAFRGQRVMLSRSLVPAEKYDMIIDKLKQNEAEVVQCSNPSYNLSDDFHVLYSFNSEKLAELQLQDCKVIGPECIFQCGKERRPLPNRKYTCCMSLEGMRVLATGFDKKEKIHIEHLVLAMCGELHNNRSMETDIVIAKDVMAQKYKWAALTLRKPIVTLDWLVQSFQQHRRAPHEPFRLQPFTGLKICATGILIDTRDKMADIIAKNGGSFKADLTRDCTHLIAKTTDSDKYKVAKRHWCNIKLVNEQWLWDSYTEQVCLEESLYTPQEGQISKPQPTGPSHLGNVTPSSTKEFLTPRDETMATDPSDIARSEREHVSQAEPGVEEVKCDVPSGLDFYLQNCRVLLAGFDSCEMKRLVGMVLDGGGTRYMELQPRLTHIVLGKPSDSDMKEIRQYALCGATHVVLPKWLEECSRQKRELVVNDSFIVPHVKLVQETHDANKLLSSRHEIKAPGSLTRKPCPEPSDAAVCEMRSFSSKTGLRAKSGDSERVSLMKSQSNSCKRSNNDTKSEKTVSGASPGTVSDKEPVAHRKDIGQEVSSLVNMASEVLKKPCSMGNIAQNVADELATSRPPSTPVLRQPFVSPHKTDVKREVFRETVFDIAQSCSSDVRTEIMHWVLEGGGSMYDSANQTHERKLDYMIVPHGLSPSSYETCDATVVTPQWVRFCLEEGTLLDFKSHVLFQPLTCDVPLPGFERLRFCIAQYDDRERLLVYNLCHVLGAKYQVKRMTRKATHLLCRVGNGEKYEAALRWGIEVVRAEWVYACVAENTLVDLYPYRPKKWTASGEESGAAVPMQLTSTSTPCGGSENEEQAVEQTKQSYDQRQISEQSFDQLQASELGGFTSKGKVGKDKRSASKRSAAVSLEGPSSSSRKQTPVSLSSQLAGGNLDPWDELSASWSSQPSSSKQAAAKSEVEGVTLKQNFKEPAAVLRDFVSCDAQKGESSGNLPESPSERPPDMTRNEESGPDVAAAIEGLLAQSHKVKSLDTEISPDGQSVRFSASGASLRRGDERTRSLSDLKRLKRLSTRPREFDEEELPQMKTSGEAFGARYQESQLESQVVSYNEDFSGKQRIMERARTRSMSLTPPLHPVNEPADKQNALWKGGC